MLDLYKIIEYNDIDDVEKFGHKTCHEFIYNLLKIIGFRIFIITFSGGVTWLLMH